MPGVFINTAAVLLGSLLGLIFRRGIPSRVTDAVMTAIGVCILFIGISGAMDGQNILISIVSMVLGAITGTLLDIDGHLNLLGTWIEKKLARKASEDEKSQTSVAQGFVTGSLLFCVGAMAVVGCLNAGLSKDYDMLITKSLLDFISAMMLSVSLGIGVMLAAGSVFLLQGSLVLLSGFLEPLLSDSAIAEMTCVGSLMILLLGFNLLGIQGTKDRFRIADFLPALIFAPILCFFTEWLSGFLH